MNIVNDVHNASYAKIFAVNFTVIAVQGVQDSELRLTSLCVLHICKVPAMTQPEVGTLIKFYHFK